MDQDTIDLDPAEHLTVDAAGALEDPLFLLQGRSGADMVTLIIDVEQAAALAVAGGELLDVLEEQYPREINQFRVPSEDSMSLQRPIHPLFEVAHFQLGYDDQRDQAAIIALELPPNDETTVEDLRVVRFWVTREQIIALVRHIENVMDTYAPICPACGEPIELEGHNCIRNN